MRPSLSLHSIVTGLCVLSLSLPFTAASQTPDVPSDAQIAATVGATLGNEQALKNQNIKAASSHGVVTLSGTVNSEAAKVLASIEAGQVNGVKSVLNNLVISGTTPVASPTHESATTEKIVTLPTETQVPIRITKTITSETAKEGDHFYGLVTNNVFAQGVIVIPAGTSVLGRVVEARSAPKFLGFPLLTIELQAIQLPKQDGTGINLPLHTATLTSRGTAARQGATPGIDGMGGLGVTGPSNRPGVNIVLREASQIRFKTSTALPLTIYMKNAIQLTLPPTPGPAELPTAPQAASASLSPAS